MCKNFRVIKSTTVSTVECIGDLFMWKENGKDKGCITPDVADMMYNQLMNKASFVRMRKRVTEMII